eukprot:CAMPEP_0170849226 /NCGR_PEP_ID=MMETSP0734-20130129/9867_1 /TAXON_ID=186038 /ORGANISM="Fragilariopsis kerguelensis, Strain L26-C5" /LENGTH=285 /DNA_ID=CAMNT_0011218825 /DNA_START=113 /DNA_END=970 /DNA_ORIENTATION=-
MIFRLTLIFAAMSSAVVAVDNTRRARSLGVRGSIRNNEEMIRELEEQDGEWTLTCLDNPMAYGSNGMKNCNQFFQSYKPLGEPYTDDKKTEVCNFEYKYSERAQHGHIEDSEDSERVPKDDSDNNNNNGRVLAEATHEIGMKIWKICQKKCAPHIEQLQLPCCPADATTTFQIQTQTEDCQWVAKGNDNRTQQECQKNSGDILVSEQCPVTCKGVDEGICANTLECDNENKFPIHIQQDCAWVGKGTDTRTINKCQMISGNGKVSDQCPETCGKVGEGGCGFLQP